MLSLDLVCMLTLYLARVLILCLQADGLPCAAAADDTSVRTAQDAPQSEAEQARMTLLQHSLPKARQRTNVSTKDYVPRGRSLGGFTTRGDGITDATLRFPEVLSTIHLLASSRPKGFIAEPYLSAHLNAATSSPLRRDKNNFSRSWLLGIGNY